MDGQAVWKRIIGAIEELQSTEKPARPLSNGSAAP
jgi:hypothetical protein